MFYISPAIMSFKGTASLDEYLFSRSKNNIGAFCMSANSFKLGVMHCSKEI